MQTQSAIRALQALQGMTPEMRATFPTVQAAAGAAQDIAEQGPVDCSYCGGAGRIDQEATLTGRNIHSACSMPCPECDGTGEVLS